MSEQVAPQAVEQQIPQAKSLHIVVKTFGPDGRPTGERIVDMYHYGTRKWLQDHQWWAMHNDHSIEVQVATDEDIGAYMFKQQLALQEKYKNPVAGVA